MNCYCVKLNERKSHYITKRLVCVACYLVTERIRRMKLPGAATADPATDLSPS